MKKLKPPASRIYKPSRRHLRRSRVRLQRDPIRTSSSAVQQDQTPPPKIRIVVETDQADLATIIKSNLPDGSYLSICELAPVGTEGSDRAPSIVDRGFDATMLTNRQDDVVRLLLTGLSNKEIGRRLDLSHFTVRNHVSQIFRLLGVTTRKDAIIRLKSCLPYKDDC
ncbi:MAG: response regulator transcription factor [Novosphingobium sp.]|nr:response regulator transcription factor [Novosphingobium sp.]